MVFGLKIVLYQGQKVKSPSKRDGKCEEILYDAIIRSNARAK